MAFNTSPGRAEYTAAAAQTIFTFTFKVFDTSDIKVYLTPAGQTADDTANILIETTDYTVTINGDNGGDVTLVSGASINDSLTLVRELPTDRETEYQNNGDLTAATLNEDQDYQTYLILDGATVSERALTVPDSVQTFDTVIPSPVASKLLVFKGDASGFDLLDPSSTSLFKDSFIVDSIAAMAGVDPNTYNSVIVRGYYFANDGGGGLFNYDASQVAVNNGGTIIDGWVRQYEGHVNVNWFGVDKTAATDSLTNLQKAFNLAGTILVDGNFIIDGRIQILSNTKVIQTKDSWIKNTDTTETIISTRPSTDNGVFEVACGNENITFDALDIRGAWYGASQPYRDNNIGINIKGRFDQFRLSEAVVGTSANITINNCRIEGFGQSGVIADQIDVFKASQNHIKNCGRDGIRMYGCVDFIVDSNSVLAMSPGYNGITPNLNVYGITATTVYQQPLADYRSSEKGQIINNNVSNCFTWKSLDTHGGRDIVFSGNTCLNSHIGIGIDKGGLDDLGNLMPAARLIVSDNIIRNTQSDPLLKRTGIAVFADGAGSSVIGQDVTIDNNFIDGFGQDANDGGMSISNQKNITINNNTIKNSLRCGIFLANTVDACVISGNIIRNVEETTLNIHEGISTASLVGNVNINGNTFIADVDSFYPTRIFTSVVNRIYFGADNASVNCLNTVGLIASVGGMVDRTIGSGSVHSAGSLLGGFNVSTAYLGVGQYTVTVNDGAWDRLIPLVNTLTSSGATAVIRNVVGDVITVYTYLVGTTTPVDSSFYISVNGYKA
jgi:parallel beta-helix repeat protein